MTKIDFQRVLEDLLFYFWEEHICPNKIYTD